MIRRALYDIAFSRDWGRQMRFITGPRQSGKTTLAKFKLKKENTESLYYLWDLRKVRNRYKENELFFTEDIPPKKKKLWLCFDEIHKTSKWKNILKGIFDEVEEYYYFIVTGSAKFEIAKTAGDSLSGRYFTFHLYPLSLDEVLQMYKTNLNPPDNLHEYLLSKLEPKKTAQEAMENLLRFGGFPEPFIKQKLPFLRKWLEDYADTVIKQDISPLTRITETDNLYDLYTLLPEFVGSTLSESSIASHIQVSPVTLKRYLKRLQDFYLLFQIYPYSKNIKRSLLRASKGYLYNWVAIQEEGARFENFVACELKSKTSLWTEASGIHFDLFYIKNKQNQETDFLITKDKNPWLLIEAKIKDVPLDKHHLAFSSNLNVPVVQLCREANIASLHKRSVFRLSASQFFS